MDRGEGVGFRRFGGVRAVDGITEIVGRSLGFLVGNGKLVVARAGVIDFFFPSSVQNCRGLQPKISLPCFRPGPNILSAFYVVIL